MNDSNPTIFFDEDKKHFARKSLLIGWLVHVCCVKCTSSFVSVLEVGVNNPACVQSMIAINWHLLILTDSPEFPRKLTIAGMVKMCKTEAKVANEGLMENGETCTQRICPI